MKTKQEQKNKKKNHNNNKSWVCHKCLTHTNHCQKNVKLKNFFSYAQQIQEAYLDWLSIKKIIHKHTIHFKKKSSNNSLYRYERTSNVISQEVQIN